MCPLHQLNEAEKILLRDQLLGYASAIGGKNSFLKLLETIHRTSPHPLVSKTALLRFPKGLIKWNKNIHRDNLSLLSTRLNARKEGNANLMASSEDKNYKNVTNMLRSLSPLTFTVAMNNEADGAGFSFKAFDIIDENTTVITPMFELFFFCPVSVAKKLLNYVPKEAVTEE
ncbi:hypothetical protein E0765_05390 [Sulfuricurvum sp. IAE1]|jgi:hypothetical protein|uniref:hypothetical protein n=1 Tax=Sulfuricurvum sp. IAE1 TaxID=2546102 RepID=UPI00104CAC21|nr:hypothetical protein [Sulfuricurvum sp. IAE1]TDA64144.1 hypothetical protein E0765_05390 [Sulfuricurvum sp. IAE1]